jgi:hypothetical protein
MGMIRGRNPDQQRERGQPVDGGERGALHRRCEIGSGDVLNLMPPDEAGGRFVVETAK